MKDGGGRAYPGRSVDGHRRCACGQRRRQWGLCVGEGGRGPRGEGGEVSQWRRQRGVGVGVGMGVGVGVGVGMGMGMGMGMSQKYMLRLGFLCFQNRHYSKR